MWRKPRFNLVANRHRESVTQQRKTRALPALRNTSSLHTHARTHTHKVQFHICPPHANPHRLREISKAVFILFSTSKDSLVARHQMPREGDAKNVASVHSDIACMNAEWRALQRPCVTCAQPCTSLSGRVRDDCRHGVPKVCAG